MEKDRLLTRQEAALRLGISPASLFSKVYRDRIGLPALKVGRLLRFRESDVERILAGETRQAATA
jgi:excisionase family DNA binding protein